MRDVLGRNRLLTAFGVAIAALLLLVSVGAYAKKGGKAVEKEGDYVVETREDGTKVKYKPKATYDFEGANIDGMYNKPSGSYISNIKEVKARTIIRIRKDFDAEVVDSARMVK